MHAMVLNLAPQDFTLNPSFHGAGFAIKVNVVKVRVLSFFEIGSCRRLIFLAE